MTDAITYHVATTNQGVGYFLRGTTWTSEPTRAATFATEADARTALDRARKFMKPAAFKAARVVAGQPVGED